MKIFLLFLISLTAYGQSSLEHEKMMKAFAEEIKQAQEVRNKFFSDPFFEHDSFDFQDSVKIIPTEKGGEIIVTVSCNGEFSEGISLSVKNHQITISGEITTINEQEDPAGNKRRSKSTRTILKNTPVPDGADESTAVMGRDGKSFTITFKKLKAL